MAENVNAQPQGVTPYLCVDGAAEAIDFYVRAFGAQELNRVPTPEGKLIHAALQLNGGMIMLSDDFAMNGGKGENPKAIGGTPVTIHLNVADVDASWNQAVAAGAEVLTPLETQFWGDRYGQLRDPFGHKWGLSGPGEPRSREEAEKAMREGLAQH